MRDKFTSRFIDLLDKMNKKRFNMNFKKFIEIFPEKEIKSKVFFFNWMKEKKVDILVDDYFIHKEKEG